ncbi:MAG: Rpn family recombination-promoting nuclease/putative transposase [Prevotellaceae bacterium]|jgi:predicted transposase/invertase (TIGR01784 family)|nr:Rpn family recombination-promoting nuclease/putative transposase [Prevotellaceae bacterium]
MRYLDPKADLTFKRVFGENPELVISFLNAILPLKEGEEILDIEYLSAELVSDNPATRKNSIVDVRCRDTLSRQFLVEMQTIWTPEFKKRVLFNTSKAYARQLGIGIDYAKLRPVYSLNLINAIYEPDSPEYYHRYQLTETDHDDIVIPDMQLVFIELPKYTPQTYHEKKMKVLWLRYLTEINDNVPQVAKELRENPLISRAIDILEESAYSPAQLAGYEKFWDAISIEKTLRNADRREGREEGIALGIAQSQVKVEAAMAKANEAMAKANEAEVKANEAVAKANEAEAKANEAVAKANEMVRQMKAVGMPTETIMQVTGLSAEAISQL